MGLSLKLPAPLRPLHVWSGYIGLAIVLSVFARDAAWTQSFMAVYLLWAIVETIRFFRLNKRQKQEQSAGGVSSTEVRPVEEEEDFNDPEVRANYKKRTEDDDVRESEQKFETLWKGSKAITFSYKNKGYGAPFDVTATVTEVICPEFGEDQDTYFKGSSVGSAPRYFCLSYVKGRKVTDVVTGEMGTLRQILGVKRRVYS